MRKIPFMDYVLFPASEEATGFHPCSNGHILRKEYMHIHSYCEIALIRSGDFIVMSENMHTSFHGPCIILFRQNCQHAQFDDNKTTYERYLLRLNQFIPDLLEPLARQIRRCAVQTITIIPLSLPQINWLYQIIEHMIFMTEYEEISCTDEQFQPSLRCLLDELFCICKTMPDLPLDFCDLNILYALTYIQEHLTEKITLDTIAEYMHCGKTKLNEDFRKYTSKSIHQYIIEERLLLSLQYLKKEYPIKTIASLCGFRDSAHYKRTFQKHYQVTPSQYKALENE